MHGNIDGLALAPTCIARLRAAWPRVLLARLQVTECDKKKREVETTKATLTSDRKCGATGFSADNAGESCLALLKIGLKKSGYYFIKPKYVHAQEMCMACSERLAVGSLNHRMR